MENSPLSRSRFLGPGSIRRRLLLLGVVLLMVVVAGLARYLRRMQYSSPPVFNDPRLTFNTPYLNTRPSVQYVSDERCAGCHVDFVEKFKSHPMGQSLGTLNDLPRIETDNALFEAGGLQYEVKRTGDSVIHMERKLDRDGKVVWELARPVAFVFGSGSRGRSYLVHHDSALFQSPISWFAQKREWDLSPGFEKGNRHFQRPIGTDCLHCHVNRFDHVAGTINKYEGNVF